MLNALHTAKKTVTARRAVLLCVAGASFAVAGAQELRLGRTMTTVAGLGPVSNLGASNLPGRGARYVGAVQGLALDSAQTHLYVSEGHAVHRIDLLTGVDTVFAGNPSTPGYSGDGGPATSALMGAPQGLTLDAAGNLYIADPYNNLIRKVTAAGIISTLTGQVNVSGAQDGPAANATFEIPTDVKFDSNGALLIVDFNRVRKYTPETGMVTTLIDSNTPGFGSSNSFRGVTVSPDGTIYLSENFYHFKVYKFSGGVLSPVAGSGVKGFNGDGNNALEYGLDPFALAFDAASNLYVADGDSRRLREVGAEGNPLLATGAIRTIAGDGVKPTLKQLLKETADAPTPGTLSDVNAVAIANNGIVYLGTGENFASGSVVAVSYDNGIVIPPGATSAIISIEILSDVSGFYAGTQATPGQVEFSVGTSTDCVTDGSVVLHAGTVCHVPVTFTAAAPGRRMAQLLVLTNSNQYVYGMEGTGYVPQATLIPGTIQNAGFLAPFVYTPGAGFTPPGPFAFNTPSSIVFDQRGNAYIADLAANTVYSVDFGNNVSKFVGNGTAGFAGDGGSQFGAKLSGPAAVALDASGILYIADAGNHRVRAVNILNSIITTVAGDGGTVNANDGALATHASLGNPVALAIDLNGDLLIADAAMRRVRRVNMITGVITTIAGDGTPGSFGDGGLATGATLSLPSGVAVAPNGDIFISDAANNIVRRIDASTGIISAYAGNGAAGSNGNFITPTSASLNAPQALLTDAVGGLYIADTGNGLVRYVTHPSPLGSQQAQIVTVGGSTTAAGVVNGGSAIESKILSPEGMALNSRNQLFVAEYTGHDFRTITGDSAAMVFPDTAVGQTSAPQRELVLESGTIAPDSAVPFSPMLTAGNAGTAANFALNVLQNESLPLCVALNSDGLKSGDSCLADVAFRPQSEGPQTGVGSFAEQTADATLMQYINFSGTGTTATALSLSPGTIPGTFTATDYSQTFTAAGGAGPLSLSETGALPSGITFTSVDGVGTLAGQTAAAGSYPFSVTVTDANAVTLTQNYTLVVTPGTIVVSVVEAIHLTDAPAMQTAIQVAVVESIQLTDAPVVTPAIQVGVVESIHLSDAPVAQPAVQIGVDEVVHVIDMVSALPAAQIGVFETVHVMDMVVATPAVQIGVSEVVHVIDTVAAKPNPLGASQTITFTGLPAAATYGAAGPYALNATASSGLAIAYSVTGPATRSGTTLTITGVGTVTVTAAQAGNASFLAASPVTQTIVIGTVQLTTSAILSKVAGGYQAVVTVTNSGGATAPSVKLTAAALGTANATVLPASLGNIPGGGSATVTLTFPSSAGADGASVVEKLTGTYTGGTFGASIRAVLP